MGGKAQARLSCKSVKRLAWPRAFSVGGFTPPTHIFCVGDLGLLNRRRVNLAIVGTRAPSLPAVLWLEEVARQLAVLKGRLMIVSGYATGIDKIAFMRAVEYAVPTVAFLPVIYEGMQLNLGPGRVFCSEHACVFRATKHWHYVKRNRLIAGAAEAVLVVQAPLGSGALITARFGLDYSKPVFFRPPAGLKDLGGVLFMSRFREARIAVNALDIFYDLSPFMYSKLILDIVAKLETVEPLKRYMGDSKRLAKLLYTAAFNLQKVFEKLKVASTDKYKIVLELAKRNWIVVYRKVIWLNVNKIYGRKEQ